MERLFELNLFGLACKYQTWLKVYRKYFYKKGQNNSTKSLIGLGTDWKFNQPWPKNIN